MEDIPLFKAYLLILTKLMKLLAMLESVKLGPRVAVATFTPIRMVSFFQTICATMTA
jgi:hypothetical protein